jgi:acyl-CoA thioester hydrolase
MTFTSREIMKITIYYEDTDCNDMVYHTAYLRFCERDRSELFFQKGLSPMPNNNEYFVVKNINANFIKSVSLGDQIKVKTQTQTIKKASAILSQEIFHNESLIFSMTCTLVYIKNNKISPIPLNFINIFKT